MVVSAPPGHLVDRIRTTPLIPVTKNPDVLVDPIRLMPVALFFGITERADLEPDVIGVTAIYQTDDPADEIGIYGKGPERFTIYPEGQALAVCLEG